MKRGANKHIPAIAAAAFGALLMGCQADQDALDADGDPVRLDRTEEIERAPAAPQEIITDEDTFPQRGDTIADTIRIEDGEAIDDGEEGGDMDGREG